MNVVVNGQRHEIDPGTTVGALIDGLGRGRAGLAVALGGEVVPRATWDERTIDDGAELDVLTAAQGG